MFTSPDPNIRERLMLNDVNNLPLTDDEGIEISLFTEDGYPIKRRVAQFLSRVDPHGVLVDLRHIHDWFTPSDDDMEIFGEEGAECRVYPQAGLRTVGHFQANGIIQPFYPLVERLNTTLSDINHGESEEEGDDLADEWVSPGRSIVVPVSCQGYNAIMHNTHGRRAQHHEVQTGMVTSALAGQWASGGKVEQEARRLSRKCDAKLPHDAYASKIDER